MTSPLGFLETSTPRSSPEVVGFLARFQPVPRRQTDFLPSPTGRRWSTQAVSTASWKLSSGSSRAFESWFPFWILSSGCSRCQLNFWCQQTYKDSKILRVINIQNLGTWGTVKKRVLRCNFLEISFCSASPSQAESQWVPRQWQQIFLDPFAAGKVL